MSQTAVLVEQEGLTGVNLSNRLASSEVADQDISEPPHLHLKSAIVADTEDIQDLYPSPSGSPQNKQLNLGTEEDEIKPSNSTALSFKSVVSDTQSQNPIIIHSSSSPHSNYIMGNNDSITPKLITKKLDKLNFTDWRWAIFNALSCKDLDGLVVKEHSDKVKADPNYDKNCKAVSSFIRLHLTTQNLERFVKDLYVHDPKRLWDDIINHFAAKNLENTSSFFDRIFETQFVDHLMEDSVNSFRHVSRQLREIGTKLDLPSIETVMSFYVLRRLPPSYATFRTLHYSKQTGDFIDLDDLLSELEKEMKRQKESQLQLLNQSTALSATHPTHNPNKPKQPRVNCSNGVHNPEANHPEADCFQAHPEKGVAYHQAAIDRFNFKSKPRASLSITSDGQDMIVLDSGALGHFLKHRSYFNSLSTTSSSVFGANGAAIPILGFGPATVQTALGPLHLPLAYYAPVSLCL
ncbi:hypothetical protein MJO28_002182 [Puccinia striiformis f. sp. tritici]|uniref:Uncharacterized protein n=1 Tax=Puccinia striiformis f. sp. tritici TaxID=168172 RepID=A0ACC0EVM8_9BASI|nr:hypothetical protein MJO28_002182 [Puccinia striiformis f. sp. tritici]